MEVGTYIYKAKMRGVDTIFVKVPKPFGGFWTEYFSINLHGEAEATRMARSSRDRYLASTSSLPSCIALSKSKTDLTAGEQEQFQQLYNFNANYRQVRVTTIAFLGAFAHSSMTLNELCELVDRGRSSFSRQIQSLTTAGLLEESGSVQVTPKKRPRKMYRLSEKGWQILRSFRSCLGLSGNLVVRTPEFYGDLYRQIRSHGLAIGPATLAVMLLVENGIIAVSRMTEVLDTRMPEVSAAIKRALDAELLEGSTEMQIIRSDGSSRPWLQLSERGHEIVQAIKSM